MIVFNRPPQSGEGIIGMHFVHPSVTFRVRSITYVCIDGLPSNLVQMLSSFETMCSDLDSDPYLKVQGHTRHLKIRLHNDFVCAITYVCIDGLPSNLVQMLSSFETMCSDLDSDPYLKVQGHTRHLKIRLPNDCVCAITYVCIDGLPSNLV